VATANERASARGEELILLGVSRSCTARGGSAEASDEERRGEVRAQPSAAPPSARARRVWLSVALPALPPELSRPHQTHREALERIVEPLSALRRPRIYSFALSPSSPSCASAMPLAPSLASLRYSYTTEKSRCENSSRCERRSYSFAASWPSGSGVDERAAEVRASWRSAGRCGRWRGAGGTWGKGKGRERVRIEQEGREREREKSQRRDRRRRSHSSERAREGAPLLMSLVRNPPE